MRRKGVESTANSAHLRYGLLPKQVITGSGTFAVHVGSLLGCEFWAKRGGWLYFMEVVAVTNPVIIEPCLHTLEAENCHFHPICKLQTVRAQGILAWPACSHHVQIHRLHHPRREIKINAAWTDINR